MKQIHRVAILGAGTMGARIAAHFANATVPSLLLDVRSPDANRPNQIAMAGLEAVKSSKPPAFFDSSVAQLISVGNFKDDLSRVAEVDWIIEAVVEDPDIKRELLQRVEAARSPGTIITTNTSGLSIRRIAEGFSQDFRRCWFGTHFFNPPRYMRLLEIVPTPETDPLLVETVSSFADLQLGKGVIVAKDTPNFIANRIGTFSVLNMMRLMQQMDFTIEEVDALTGPVIGWPRSATFRTLDLVGIDVLHHVACNMPEEQDVGLLSTMVDRHWLGDKVGSGFYKRAEDGSRLVLDWKTFDYRPPRKPTFPALEMAKNVDDVKARLALLLESNSRVSQFLWSALGDLWSYCARCVPEISDSIGDIDRAMRLGFNWELGPFEMWDAVGVEASLEHMKDRPANLQKLLVSGKKFWYIADTNWDPRTEDYERINLPVGLASVAMIKKSKGAVKKNSGASLVDLGDGVACIEFHSKMNTISGDIVSLITQTLEPSGLEDWFDACVITSDSANFSAGANLMLLLLWAQDEEWDEIDLAIRQFQAMTQAIKFSPKPVVLAPFGLTLGGACEMSLHAAARQPHCELYMGLVEAAVGLLPAGGGCKEMLLQALRRGERTQQINELAVAFDTIASSKTSSSAHEARAFGMLHDSDGVTMNRERLLSDAKQRALELSRATYLAPVRRHDIPAPGLGVLEVFRHKAKAMLEKELITEHDHKIAVKISEVLCGGTVASGTAIDEQQILDLEREAFKSLCGEPRTQQRIHHMLKTGKPLRN